MISLFNTKPSFYKFLSSCLSAVFLISLIIFFKFSIHNIGYSSFYQNIKPKVQSSNAKIEIQYYLAPHIFLVYAE